MSDDAGSELFGSYEAELKLAQADLNQKLDQVSELSGEPRKAAVRQAERSLEDTTDIVRFFACPKSLCSMIALLTFGSSSTKCASRNRTYPPPRAAK